MRKQVFIMLKNAKKAGAYGFAGLFFTFFCIGITVFGFCTTICTWRSAGALLGVCGLMALNYRKWRIMQADDTVKFPFVWTVIVDSVVPLAGFVYLLFDNAPDDFHQRSPMLFLLSLIPFLVTNSRIQIRQMKLEREQASAQNAD